MQRAVPRGDCLAVTRSFLFVSPRARLTHSLVLRVCLSWGHLSTGEQSTRIFKFTADKRDLIQTGIFRAFLGQTKLARFQDHSGPWGIFLMGNKKPVSVDTLCFSLMCRFQPSSFLLGTFWSSLFALGLFLGFLWSWRIEGLLLVYRCRLFLQCDYSQVYIHVTG